MTTYSPRYTRMVKSYAPVKNALTEILDIDKHDNTPIMVYCKVSRKYYTADEFYVKKYRQEKDPRNLHVQDFRHVCKEIWDQRVKNQKAGHGWVSDDELMNPPSTIDVFLSEDENNER